MADSTNAQIGSQTTLSYWDTSLSPDAWTLFPNIRSFGEIGSDRPEVDSTDLDSDAVERIGGLPDGKEIAIVLVANTVTVPLLESIYNAGDNIDLKETFPAPLSVSRYFSMTPLGFTQSSITPTGLVETTLRGRITGTISSTPSHP